MQNYIKKYESLKLALTKLEDSASMDDNEIVKDATLQRFHYSYELLWRCSKDYLLLKDGLVCNSPNQCFVKLNECQYINEIESKKLIETTELKIDIFFYFDLFMTEKFNHEINDIIELFKAVASKIDPGTMN